MLLWKITLGSAVALYTPWGAVRPPQGLLRAEQSRHSACLHKRAAASPVINLVPLIWTHSDGSVCVLCWAPHGTPGQVSPQQSRAEFIPSSCCPHCFGCCPGLTWASSFSVELLKGTNLCSSHFSKRDFSWAVYMLQCNNIEHVCLSQHNNILEWGTCEKQQDFSRNWWKNNQNQLYPHGAKGNKIFAVVKRSRFWRGEKHLVASQ